jgi:hypothetical protein
MNTEALQVALFDRLSTDAALIAALSDQWGFVPIFADVPEIHGEDDRYFPYVTIGNEVATPWNTKSTLGAEVSVQIDVWTRTADYVQAKSVASLIYDRLERQDLSIAGAHHVTTDVQSISTSLDPDGRTRRALMLFTVIYDKLPPNPWSSEFSQEFG